MFWVFNVKAYKPKGVIRSLDPFSIQVKTHVLTPWSGSFVARLEACHLQPEAGAASADPLQGAELACGKPAGTGEESPLWWFALGG